MKVKHQSYIILLISIMFSIDIDAQCIGDNIVKNVNANTAINKAVRKTFGIKKRHCSIIINADTSSVYWNRDFPIFKDSLINYGYSKTIVDSLSKLSLKLSDTLGEMPSFCGQQYILNKKNYDTKEYNLVILLNQYNDSIVIGELIYCIGEYHDIRTLRKPELIDLMFLLDEKGDVKRVIIIPDKSYPNTPLNR